MIKEARDGMEMSEDTTVFLKRPEKSPTALMALSREWRTKMAKKKEDPDTDKTNTELILGGFASLTDAMAQDRNSSDRKFIDLYDKHNELDKKVIVLALVQNLFRWILATVFGGLVVYFITKL